MTEHDLDLIEFPEWSQWGEGHDRKSGTCCECLRYGGGAFGYCCLHDEIVNMHDTCGDWKFYDEL